MRHHRAPVSACTCRHRVATATATATPRRQPDVAAAQAQSGSCCCASACTLHLPDRGLVAALPAGGAPAVYVVAGTAWVTQEGDARDHIVAAGGSVALARHGRIVVQAIAAAGADVRLRDTRCA